MLEDNPDFTGSKVELLKKFAERSGVDFERLADRAGIEIE
jgi:hypothetical protein